MGFTVRRFLCFDLERIRDHFYSRDPPMAVGKSGLGFALSQSKAEQMACSHQTGGFTVRRFLCFELERFQDHFYSLDPPHGGWQKWSRICCILKHKKVRAMVGNSNLVGEGPVRFSGKALYSTEISINPVYSCKCH